MTDMVLVGRISNVQRQNGVSQMGKEWTSTSFNLERTKVRKNGQGVYENYTETIPLSGFGEFGLAEGGIYQVGVDIKLRQSQNGGTYPNLSVQWAEPVYVERNQPSQNPQNNGYQQGYAPQQGYQQNNGYQQGYAQPRQPMNQMNGQESFRNDDIPF